MARKRKHLPEPTREEQLTHIVSGILNTEHITPGQLYDLLLMGHKVYKQGIGLPECHVIAAILLAFTQQGRHYMNPYQMAQLKGLSHPLPEDWESLNT